MVHVQYSTIIQMYINTVQVG